MATDNSTYGQNFRANYYHKLGSTAAVEDKKSLLKLLKSIPLDIRKLEQFCQHLHIPSDYRSEVWKIMLNITPKYRSTLDYVVQQRQEHYQELGRVVDVMRLVPQACSESDIHKWTAMYLVETQAIAMCVGDIYESEQASIFSAIANAVERLDFTPCDSYWISRNMTNLVHERVIPHLQSLIEKTWLCIKKEDIGGKIIEHLQSIVSVDKIPLAYWFSTCFADVFPDTTFERLWDKVIAGSCAVMIYVAAALILINRRPILVMKSSHEILNLFNCVQSDTADEIVRRGIDSWYRNGGKLTPSSSRASPSSRNTDTPPITSTSN